MNRSTLLLIILFNSIALSILADPSNPQATRGNITVVSSEFGEGEAVKKYSVGNAIDGNPETAWVFEKKATSFKDVVGLLFDFKSAQEIDGISLINGYAKNDSLYKQNSSIRTFKIILPDHHVYYYTCSETKNYQDFRFPKQTVKWMIIIVTSEQKGTKYNDLCISEISPTVKNEKLIYDQPNYILNNNGGEYESDLIINLQNKKQFNTEKFDFGCGAKDPFYINDSIIVYHDGCDDSSHIEMFYLDKMVAKTMKNQQLNNYTLIEPISETLFIMIENNSEKFFKFNTELNKFISANYTIKNEFKYWRWSERLNNDLSDYYKKIE